MHKAAPKAPQQEDPTSRSFVSYREVDVIFGAYPLEGTTSREKVIYINEACRSNYPMMLIVPPPFPSRSISFFEDDA